MKNPKKASKRLIKRPNYLNEFRPTFHLLDKEARIKFVILALLQVAMAILEVIALAIITITLSLALDAYSAESREERREFILPSFLPANLTVFGQMGVLIGIYTLLVFSKIALSAFVTWSTFNLLSKESAETGFKIHKETFRSGNEIIRFGKSQENLIAVTGSLDSILIGYLGSCVQLLGDIATVAMVCIALLFFDVQTALLLFLLIAFLFWVLRKLVNEKAAHLSEKIIVDATELNRKILDSWLVYREIILAQKVEDLIKPTRSKRKTISKNRALMNFLPSLSKYIFEIFLLFSALVVSGIQLWIGGINSALNSLALMIAASARLIPAFLRLQGNLLSVKQFKGAGIYTKRILKHLDEATKNGNPNKFKEPKQRAFEAKIIVERLSFTYPESVQPTLSDVTLSMNPGSFTAITGASGCGKSTLIDLILGFLTPTLGSVTVSGVEPGVARGVWPGKIAYVPQDIQIFEGTILENITLDSSGETSYRNLNECIRSSGLFQDLIHLEQGLQTQIGERGLKLSGGQKQRLGIARALYSDPQLLVLDEATSSLDPITENEIMKNLYERVANRAVIVIAHRLSTVKQADNIYYLKDGKILGSGSFEKLKSTVPDFNKQAELSGL